MPSENRYILFEDKSCFVGVLHQVKHRRELALKRQGVKLTQLSRKGCCLFERTNGRTADDWVYVLSGRAWSSPWLHGRQSMSAEPRNPQKDLVFRRKDGMFSFLRSFLPHRRWRRLLHGTVNGWTNRKPRPSGRGGGHMIRVLFNSIHLYKP